MRSYNTHHIAHTIRSACICAMVNGDKATYQIPIFKITMIKWNFSISFIAGVPLFYVTLHHYFAADLLHVRSVVWWLCCRFSHSLNLALFFSDWFFGVLLLFISFSGGIRFLCSFTTNCWFVMGTFLFVAIMMVVVVGASIHMLYVPHFFCVHATTILAHT